MDRLNILIWHIHGSYLNALARVDHNWYVPTKPGKPEGYGGRGHTFDLTDNVIEVPAERVRDLELDLIVYQTPRNLFHDHFDILSTQQQLLPKIYLEHNTPKPDAVHTRHPAIDADGGRCGAPPLLVHVTHFNRLMWDNGDLRTIVIEHSVAIDPALRYRGSMERGITVANGIEKRPRIAGYDIFMDVREKVPLDAVGMGTEQYGGFGDVPYRDLHRLVGEYRFLFSPIRYTSLPLAVVEAMTLGMPVVALATTEVPSVIQDGETGFVSCDVGRLIDDMHLLLRDSAQAHRIGENARRTALERFGLDRFTREWNAACLHGVETQTHPGAPREREGRVSVVA